jgi:hypothetical protein
MDALKATHLEALEEIARIDSRIRDKVLSAPQTGHDQPGRGHRLVEVEACRGATDHKHRECKGH